MRDLGALLVVIFVLLGMWAGAKAIMHQNRIPRMPVDKEPSLRRQRIYNERSIGASRESMASMGWFGLAVALIYLAMADKFLNTW